MQEKGLRSMKRNAEKRQENEPARERDSTAESEAETHRGGQKEEVTSSEPNGKRGAICTKDPRHLHG